MDIRLSFWYFWFFNLYFIFKMLYRFHIKINFRSISKNHLLKRNFRKIILWIQLIIFIDFGSALEHSLWNIKIINRLFRAIWKCIAFKMPASLMKLLLWIFLYIIKYASLLQVGIFKKTGIICDESGCRLPCLLQNWERIFKILFIWVGHLFKWSFVSVILLLNFSWVFVSCLERYFIFLFCLRSSTCKKTYLIIVKLLIITILS